MKAPVTTPSVKRFGYPGNSKTADRKKFTERYYEWTRKTLEGKYGRVDLAEDAFNDLINDILKTRGIHRNERNRGYKVHTLIITRAKGCFWRIAAKPVFLRQMARLEKELPCPLASSFFVTRPRSAGRDCLLRAAGEMSRGRWRGW